LLLKLSLNILQPRQWSVYQSISDAYMTYERAVAERVPFEDLTKPDSDWPVFPEVSSSEVEIGRIVGGRPVFGTVNRTRLPDANNWDVINDPAEAARLNPSAMETWRVQSILTYQVGDKTYYKARTVIRSQ
jgi:hypothetical protein